MRILFIGDIVGKPGRHIVVPRRRRARSPKSKLDLVVANAENAAGGSGLTPAIYHELIAAGVDGITLGDHVYRRREIYSVLESEPNIVKPANFPPESAGRELGRRHRPQRRARRRSSACWAGCSCRRSIAPGTPPTACSARCPPTSACSSSTFTPRPPATSS